MGGLRTGGERLQSRFVAFEIIGVIKFVRRFLRIAFRQSSCLNFGGAAWSQVCSVLDEEMKARLHVSGANNAAAFGEN